MSRLPCLAIALLLPACFHPDLDHTRCSTTDNPPCPGSQTCVAGFCEASSSSPSPDAAGPSADCWPRWLDGSLAFDTPMPAIAINPGDNDRDPWISPGGQRLYYTYQNDGNPNHIYLGNAIPYTPPEPPPNPPFAPGTALFNKMAAYSDSHASFDADENLIAWTSDRAGGRWNTYIASVNPDRSINTPSELAYGTSSQSTDPFLTADGSQLYLAPGDGLQQHIVVATRVQGSTDFGIPSPVDFLASMPSSDPALSPDGRVLIFTTISDGDNDLAYVRKRDNGDTDFDELVPLRPLNTNHNEFSAMPSADGCELYFSRNLDPPSGSDMVPDTSGLAAIYVAHVVI